MFIQSRISTQFYDSESTGLIMRKRTNIISQRLIVPSIVAKSVAINTRVSVSN